LAQVGVGCCCTSTAMAQKSADLKFSIDKHGIGEVHALRDLTVKITDPDGDTEERTKQAGELVASWCTWSWSPFAGPWKLETDAEIVQINWTGRNGWVGLEVKSKAAAVQDGEKRSAPAPEAEEPKQAEYQAEEKQKAERQEEKRGVVHPKGVSVQFLVTRFDRLLRKTFGAKYNDSTTFADLGELLWGPAKDRFSNIVDFLGHASMFDEGRGKNGVSLCDAIAKSNPEDVGDASLFISWTWKYTVKKFLQVIRDYCVDKNLDMASTYLWICFLCNNQFTWLSGEAQDGVEAFGDAVKQIGKVVCVVDSFDAQHALYFSRLWTVFEVFTACVAGIEIDFALLGDSELELDEMPLGQLKKMIVVNVLLAEASDPNDVAKIRAEISSAPGGAEFVNAKVSELFAKLIFNYLLDR